MPDLPTIGGGPSETGSTPGSSTGISMTTGASHTKGATWTELIAATDYASSWLLVSMGVASAFGAASGFLMDIGVGASTAEQTLIPNLHFSMPASTTSITQSYLFPLAVPAGTRLSARAQCSTATQTILATVAAIAGPIDGPPGLRRVETIGAVTGTTRGTQLDMGGSAHTDVVAQLSAATGFAYRWLCLSAANVGDVVLAANTTFLIDVVTGAGGSEVPVLADIWLSATTTSDFCGPKVTCFPCSIAAGARVAVRGRCSVNTAGDRVLDFVAHGVG
jgi:hypothetical protein